MKTSFDFSQPQRVSLVLQAKSKDGEQWNKPTVVFVVDTIDADVLESVLDEEAASHKDWTLQLKQKNERVLKFNGFQEHTFKKLFTEETTLFLTSKSKKVRK